MAWHSIPSHLTSKPRAILIDVVDPRLGPVEEAYRLAEARSLVDTYGGLIVVETMQKRTAPDSRTHVGRGKLAELAELMKQHSADVLIINNTLKPRQIYQIEKEIRPVIKPRIPEVWDRVDLILKIFSKHARSAEAKLQITLASLHHMGPRIYQMGMDLSQQGGGIGTRGAGETNTEMMKRHLRKNEETVKKKIAALSKVRDNQRYGRKRRGVKTVSIVGYTNAGKSSLQNALTRKGTYVADQLFATLDTNVAELYLPNVPSIVLSDTIGFIQDLPPKLITAFRSTLEEAIEADLLLLVIDATDNRVANKIAVVENILAQLKLSDHPRWYVWNKLDDGSTDLAESLAANYPEFNHLFVSAKTGFGLQALKQAIGDFFSKK